MTLTCLHTEKGRPPCDDLTLSLMWPAMPDRIDPPPDLKHGRAKSNVARMAPLAVIGAAVVRTCLLTEAQM